MLDTFKTFLYAAAATSLAFFAVFSLGGMYMTISLDLGHPPGDLGRVVAFYFGAFWGGIIWLILTDGARHLMTFRHVRHMLGGVLLPAAIVGPSSFLVMYHQWLGPHVSAIVWYLGMLCGLLAAAATVSAVVFWAAHRLFCLAR